MSPRKSRSFVVTPQAQRIIDRLVGGGVNLSGAFNMIVTRFDEVVKRHTPHLSDDDWQRVYQALDEPIHDAWAIDAIDHLLAAHIDNQETLRSIKQLSYAEKVALVTIADQHRAGETPDKPGD